MEPSCPGNETDHVVQVVKQYGKDIHEGFMEIMTLGGGPQTPTIFSMKEADTGYLAWPNPSSVAGRTPRL